MLAGNRPVPRSLAMMPALVLLLAAGPALATEPADLIVHRGRVVTLDGRSRIVQAVAVRGGRIVAVGEDKTVLGLRGPKTRVIDARGRTVLPGLMDSHVHPVGVVTTELADPPPVIRSLADAFAYIRKRAGEVPRGEWIVLRFAFPTRLDEARFPTRAELDAAAPDHPVLFNAGPAGMVNSRALAVSKVTRDTPNPTGGMVVKDARTAEPTGLLRNAYSVLRGVPSPSARVKPKALREGVKKLFRLYNEQGLTSIADRNAGSGALTLYRELARAGELGVRVNVAPTFDPSGTRELTVKRLEALEGKDRRNGPSGAGDDWVRVGPLKMFLDGGMLNGTAYMRQPWPPGPTYQVTEKDYRGLLFIKPARLQMVVEEAAKRRWQVTAHTAGEAAMDVLLDAYEQANRTVPIKPLRFCIAHANFPSKSNLQRCKELGVCADVQPAWLYKDGATLGRILPAKRMRWFQPYKTWLEYTTIGGGSDHMLRYDSLDSTNPWNPWLGIWVALTRSTERGGKIEPGEALTREQALRLYTTNNAYLHHEEKLKGSLEVGKLGDLIIIDRDVLKCPVDDVRKTRVLLTVVGGKVVYEQRE
jgi:predicted amidohydrolase YtcJ